jgi:RNA polymerase sigma-70 factor (ECF subfamily)
VSVRILPKIAREAQCDDAQLMRAIAEGDLGALGDLYDRYARDVWRAIRRMVGSSNDVEDVVHAVFLKVPEIASHYDGRSSCRAWLCGIAVRTAMRHRRGFGRLQRMLASFAHTVDAAAPSASPEREASGREELEVFERALAKLSPKKRAAFVLVEIEGLTPEQVARSLDVPAATVRTRLFHARKELANAMREEGGGEP